MISKLYKKFPNRADWYRPLAPPSPTIASVLIVSPPVKNSSFENCVSPWKLIQSVDPTLMVTIDLKWTGENSSITGGGGSSNSSFDRERKVENFADAGVSLESLISDPFIPFSKDTSIELPLKISGNVGAVPMKTRKEMIENEIKLKIHTEYRTGYRDLKLSARCLQEVLREIEIALREKQFAVTMGKSTNGRFEI
nr:hypothetical protein Iba_chr14dCG8340 [Ipomoea batatas]